MTAPLLCRRVVPPQGTVGAKPRNIRLSERDPIAAAVHVATKRWPGHEEAGPLWRSLEGAGWRLEEVHGIDKACVAPGCPEDGAFGFGPIGPPPERSLENLIWTCAAHRDLGRAHLAACASGSPPSSAEGRNRPKNLTGDMHEPIQTAPEPRQGSLFG